MNEHVFLLKKNKNKNVFYNYDLLFFLTVLAGCRNAYCGDGIQNMNTEECDGDDFGERSCTSYRQGLALFSLLLPNMRSHT